MLMSIKVKKQSVKHVTKYVRKILEIRSVVTSVFNDSLSIKSLIKLYWVQIVCLNLLE